MGGWLGSPANAQPDETNLMEAFVLPIGMPYLGRG